MQDLKDLKRRFSRVRSRGTGPRATGQGAVLLAMRRSGSGDPELQFLVNLANRDNLENLAHLFANFAHYDGSAK